MQSSKSVPLESISTETPSLEELKDADSKGPTTNGKKKKGSKRKKAWIRWTSCGWEEAVAGVAGVLMGVIVGTLVLIGGGKVDLCRVTLVEQWSPWSVCSATCGMGEQTRWRKVEFEHGETECNQPRRLPLTDSRSCSFGFCCGQNGYGGVGSVVLQRCYVFANTKMFLDEALIWPQYLDHHFVDIDSVLESRFIANITGAQTTAPLWTGRRCNLREGCVPESGYFSLTHSWFNLSSDLHDDEWHPVLLYPDGVFQLSNALLVSSRRHSFLLRSPLLRSSVNCDSNLPCYRISNNIPELGYGIAHIDSLRELLWLRRNANALFNISTFPSFKVRIGTVCHVKWRDDGRMSVDCRPNLRWRGFQAAIDDFKAQYRNDSLPYTRCVDLDLAVDISYERWFEIVPCDSTAVRGRVLQRLPFCPHQQPSYFGDGYQKTKESGDRVVWQTPCHPPKEPVDKNNCSHCKAHSGNETCKPIFRSQHGDSLPYAMIGNQRNSKISSHEMAVLEGVGDSPCASKSAPKTTMHTQDCTWDCCPSCVKSAFQFCYRLESNANAQPTLYSSGDYGNAENLLVTIHDAKEQERVVSIAKRYLLLARNAKDELSMSAQFFRIGLLCNSSSKSECQWLDRTKVDYENFADGHPIKLLSCVALDAQNAFKWVSTPCFEVDQQHPHLYELYRHCDKSALTKMYIGKLFAFPFYRLSKYKSRNICIEQKYSISFYWNCESNDGVEEDLFPEECTVVSELSRYFYYAVRSRVVGKMAPMVDPFHAAPFNRDTVGFLDRMALRLLQTEMAYYTDRDQHYWLPIECKFVEKLSQYLRSRDNCFHADCLIVRHYTIHLAPVNDSLICRYIGEWVRGSEVQLKALDLPRSFTWYTSPSADSRTTLREIEAKCMERKDGSYPCAAYATFYAHGLSRLITGEADRFKLAVKTDRKGTLARRHFYDSKRANMAPFPTDRLDDGYAYNHRHSDWTINLFAALVPPYTSSECLKQVVKATKLQAAYGHFWSRPTCSLGHLTSKARCGEEV